MKRKFRKILVWLLVVLMMTSSSILPVAHAADGDSHDQIPELLEGDKAWIDMFGLSKDDETESGYSIRTGTAPFDKDDEPGNDSCATNNVVRTFDAVSYTVEFYTALQKNIIDEGTITGFKDGSVYFEYILPANKKQAVFDTDAMGWLTTLPEIVYEIAEVEIDGVESQVLRGSYLLTPTDGNPSAIGHSFYDLTVTTMILDMKNGENFEPKFTMWLKDNDVGTTYHGNYAGIPDTIVYGSDYVCASHGEKEYQSFIAPPVRVSSAPSYNVEVVKTSHANNTLVGNFDFATGNDSAVYKDIGTVNGRMYGFGLSLQICGNGAKGLMGVELPDGSDISFDLNLTTTYIKSGGETITPLEIEDGYKALLWSGDANMNAAVAPNGRQSKTYTNYILGGLPFNKDLNSVYDLKTNDFNYCKNGGEWTFVADENDPTKIHVTVSGYEVDLTALPYNTTNTEKTSSKAEWYTPSDVVIGDDGRIEQFWKVKTACISAGKMWVVQPYYNDIPLLENFSDRGQTDFEQYHIKDLYGAGTINTALEDIDLDMISVTGISTLDAGQAKTTDDYRVYDYAFERPGSESTTIRYTRHKSNDHYLPLTDDCSSSNADWAVSGQNIGIRATTVSSNAEGLSSAVAIHNVIKFDDVFFEPESTSFVNSKSTSTYTPNKAVLWGAKPDKKGWDHKGLKPDEAGYDTEMMKSCADDLVWFSSLDELKAQGYVPVAVLFEQNGPTSVSNGGYCELSTWVYGSIKTDCKINYAYATACEGYIWSKGDIIGDLTEKTGKKVADITDADYAAYVKDESFFSRLNGDKLSADTVHAPHYQKNGAKTDAFVNSIKAVYEDGVYVIGSGAPYYIDSCYVIPFKSKITKNVAQKTDTNDTKKNYDLGANQRVVDYVMNPYIERGHADGDSALDNMTTNITITDTLPKGLSYIIGSAVYSPDGSAVYKQGTDCQIKGTVTGAQVFDPSSITYNSDGTTTIVWTIKDVVINPNVTSTDLGLIYFSAYIGTPLNEATDVVNQQELTNEVIISSDYDLNTLYGVDSNGNIIDAYSYAKGNLATASIRVLKQLGISLVKVSSNDAIDKGEPINYTVYIGNNRAKSYKDMVLVENLPFSGDKAGSHFTGERYITKFAADSNSEGVYRSFRYFYTTNKAYADKDSSEYLKESWTADTFASSEDWIELNLADSKLSDRLFTNLPSPAQQKGDKQIVSIAAVGDLASSQVVKFSIDLAAPDTETNDKLVNTVSLDRLRSQASNVVISRAISGIVWIDEDNNGKKDENEELVEDTTIVLLKKDESGKYVPVIITDLDGNSVPAIIRPGEKINLISGEKTQTGDGEYCFDGLGKGDYSIIFSGDTTVKDIIMPSANELNGSAKYEVIQNVGINTISVTMTKEWVDDDDLDKLRGDYGVTLYANGEPYSEEVILDKDTLEYTWDKLPYLKNGVPVVYSVVETTCPKGYTTHYNGYKLTNVHEPTKDYIPVVFFAPDNIGYQLADGITYYTSIDGRNKTVSKNTQFHDSTTIYVERGEIISFKPFLSFTSWKGDYLAAIKSGENELTALPITVEADKDGYYTFRASNGYYFVTLVQYGENVVTGEKLPWYQFLIDLINKIKEFFQNIFK